MKQKKLFRSLFLSTPSGWRATSTGFCYLSKPPISIHALRVEGDSSALSIRAEDLRISIHALRVEGDITPTAWALRPTNFYPRPPGGGRPCEQRRFHGRKTHFYPRPPGGGRQQKARITIPTEAISIHALRVEGDAWSYEDLCNIFKISIHALRVEGDPITQ